MALIIGIAILTFLFYFCASYNEIKIEHKILFIFLFVVASFWLRILINPNLNKDYYGYFDLTSFDARESFISFLLSEPYIYILYKSFALFTNDKTVVFLMIYWFNLLLTNGFFIWLLTKTDVQMWKKMVLFVFYYFLFGYVLLRNGPVYMLFAMYFYYSYRGGKFQFVFLAPLFHLSSVALMPIFFYKIKKYFLYLLTILFFLVPIIIFFIMPLLSNLLAVQTSLSKADTYTAELGVVSVFHKIYFFFITFIFLVSGFVYRRNVLHPIIITTLIIYYIGFLINPVVGFRFTPYIFFAILFFKYDGYYNQSFTRMLNITSVLLLPYFIFTLFDTHYL